MTLRQHILKYPERYVAQAVNTVPLDLLRGVLMDRKTINVNITEMAIELWGDTAHWTELWHKVLESKRPITPPFKTMWMEYPGGEGQIRVDGPADERTGILVLRQDTANGHNVLTVAFEMGKGYVTNLGTLATTLSKEGAVDNERFEYTCNEIMVRLLGLEEVRARLANIGILTCCVLAHLHCQNVELVSLPSPAPSVKHHKGPVPRFSEWHEIRVKPDAVRKLCREAGRTTLDPTGSAKLSWVRGHYADYRNGPGLFGNPKLRVLLWVPEFQRGNAELGEVIPEYTPLGKSAS